MDTVDLTFTELSGDGMYLAASANVPAETSHVADQVLSTPSSTRSLAFWNMENSNWDFSLLAVHTHRAVRNMRADGLITVHQSYTVIFILRQGGYVFIGVCLLVCL